MTGVALLGERATEGRSSFTVGGGPQVAADAREYFGNQVFETVIPRNIRLAEAPSFGKPIILYDVASIGAQSYMSVAKELIARNTAAPAPAGPALVHP